MFQFFHPFGAICSLFIKTYLRQNNPDYSHFWPWLPEELENPQVTNYFLRSHQSWATSTFSSWEATLLCRINLDRIKMVGQISEEDFPDSKSCHQLHRVYQQYHKSASAAWFNFVQCHYAFIRLCILHLALDSVDRKAVTRSLQNSIIAYRDLSSSWHLWFWEVHYLYYVLRLNHR